MTWLERFGELGGGFILLVVAWFLMWSRKNLQQILEDMGGYPGPARLAELIAIVMAVGLGLVDLLKVTSGISG